MNYKIIAVLFAVVILTVIAAILLTRRYIRNLTDKRIAENEIYLQYSEISKNKTSVYISHRLSSTRFCDRIVLLDENRIAETGNHEELMKLGGKYAEMFNIQSKYYREGGAENE